MQRKMTDSGYLVLDKELAHSMRVGWLFAPTLASTGAIFQPWILQDNIRTPTYHPL